MSILLDAAEASIVLKGLSKLPYDATNRLHYLVVHAKEGKFHLLGNEIDQLVGAEEFALWIKNAKKADNVTPVFNTNDKIVLLSCNDAPSSQALADALGELPNTPRSVIAWEGEVKVYENGRIEGAGACKEYRAGQAAQNTTPPVGKVGAEASGAFVRLHSAVRLVDNLNLGNLVRRVGQYEVFEQGEVFYRAMKRADFDYLVANGKIRVPLDHPGAEVFTSPSLDYIIRSDYLGDNIIVKFKLKSGTLDEFVANGVRNDFSDIMREHFPNMPQVQSGWMTSKALFKTETTRDGIVQQINIGLGRNGWAFNKFNQNILEIQKIVR